MDPDALNYRANATKPDATCTTKVPGCTLEGAPNYNPAANFSKLTKQSSSCF